jgi:hypothetical protein
MYWYLDKFHTLFSFSLVTLYGVSYYLILYFRLQLSETRSVIHAVYI